MSEEFCEEILGDSCEEGPAVSIPMPEEGSLFAVLGVVKEIIYDREESEDGPEDHHVFTGEVFILASPPSEDTPQVLLLTGPGLKIDGHGIIG